MKILVINGSPKGEKSNTMNVTRAFLSGFPEGTEIDFAELQKLDIKPCLGCYSCWGKTDGRCVINDDMQMLREKILAADIIVESFPLYFFGMPSKLKTMTDRCLPFMMPYLGNIVEERNICFHELREKSLLEKKLVVISSCGYVDANAVYPALLNQLDLICGKGKYTAILCGQGELFISGNAKRQRDGYLNDVKKAGEEFAEKLSLSEETKNRVAKPILSPKGFETITAAHWEEKRRVK
ncbi:MAG: flavodoxin family protein [Oscillospiraceae bacterium]|nr:flavodoxin family protein [Oscillospiraceae bacterium]